MSATGRSAPGPIAFFLPSVRGGGAQRVVVNLIQGITERAIPVDLVLATATGPFLKQLSDGVRLVDLRSNRLMGSLAPLIGYLRRERPRVVVSSMTHANLVTLWAARLAGTGTPVVVTVHNTLSQAARPAQCRGRGARTVPPADLLSRGRLPSWPCLAAPRTTWPALRDCPGTGWR